MFFKRSKNSMIIPARLHERLVRSHPKEQLEGEIVAARSGLRKEEKPGASGSSAKAEPARTVLIRLKKKELKKVAGY
jgi:hypothetical protein